MEFIYYHVDPQVVEALHLGIVKKVLCDCRQELGALLQVLG